MSREIRRQLKKGVKRPWHDAVPNMQVPTGKVSHPASTGKPQPSVQSKIPKSPRTSKIFPG